MKKTTFALAGLALICVTPAYANNTASTTVTVSGTIVASLEISTATQLTMPHLVARGTTSGADTSVTVACGATNATNTVTYSGNGNPFANGVAAAASPAGAGSANQSALPVAAATGTCGQVSVVGDTTYSFNVVPAVTIVAAATGVSLSAPLCYNAGVLINTGDAVALVAGAKTLDCGATITTDATAVAGTFTNSAAFSVTVTYD